MRRYVTALVLVLATLVPAGFGAEALYHCRFDGEIRTRCCCPENAEHRTLRAQGDRCCDVRVAAQTKQPVKAFGGPTTFQDTPLLTQLFLISQWSEDSPFGAFVFRRTHPRGPPIFIRFCSYLI